MTDKPEPYQIEDFRVQWGHRAATLVFKYHNYREPNPITLHVHAGDAWVFPVRPRPKDDIDAYRMAVKHLQKLKKRADKRRNKEGAN